jgi:hypothetical protein
MRSSKWSVGAVATGALLFTTLFLSGEAVASPPLFVGMGDSIGEAVQSADANKDTQPTGYLSLIASRMGAAFPLPLIQTSPTATIFSVDGRSRIDPTVEGLNLAVNGADAHSILYDRAVAADASQISDETEMVLFPRTGSQIEVTESLMPQRVACWIGNNDVLGALLDFNHLDASQLTPIADFTNDFSALVQRLSAIGAQTVFGTVPNVTDIAFLADDADLVRFLGSDYGLPADSRTTIATVFLVKLGLLPASVFSNPNFVLDAGELATIQQQVVNLNNVIKTVAASYGMGVADTNATFANIAAHPPVIAGVTLTPRFLGGLFSLDGVHPAPFANAILANTFIKAFNARYGLGVPTVDTATLGNVFVTDPFVDKDGDGVVRGRFLRGLLETLGPFVGISGDLNDRLPSPTMTDANGFFNQYQKLTGVDLRTASREEKINAIRRLFGIPAFTPRQ